MAVDPTSRFLYVVNLPSILGGSNDISAYAINATTGALTPVPGSLFSFANQMPCALAIEPTGRFVYLTSLSPSSSVPGSVSAYAINGSDGSLALVAGSNIATGLSPNSIAVDLTGAFLYVTDSNSSVVFAYVINSTTGSLAR
jgi:6-phosphogluconolactonase